MCKSNSPRKSFPPVILICCFQLPWCNFSIVVRPNFMACSHLTEVPNRGTHITVLWWYKTGCFLRATLPEERGGMTGCWSAVPTHRLTLAVTDIPGIAQRIFGTAVLPVNVGVHKIWARRTTYLLCSHVPSFYLGI